MSKMPEAISPKIDYVFKRIFGVPSSSDILADFLSSIMEFKEGELDHIEFSDKELAKENASDKASILDVRVVTAAKTEIDIEIQIAYQQAMAERSLYYWSKMFSGQIEAGYQYERLQKAICINILNFNLFDAERYHSRFLIKEDTDGAVMTDKFRIDFLELPKALKAAANTTGDKLLDWLRFISASSDNKEVLKMLSEKSEPMHKAVGVLVHLSEDEQARRDALRREMFLHDQAQREAENLERGREEGQTELIRKMCKAGMPIAQIAEISGRSEAEIRKILQ